MGSVKGINMKNNKCFFLEKKETETEMCLNAFTRITGNIKANTPKNYTKRFLSYDFSIKK